MRLGGGGVFFPSVDVRQASDAEIFGSLKSINVKSSWG